MGRGVAAFPVLMGWGAPGDSPGVICLLHLMACGGWSWVTILEVLEPLAPESDPSNPLCLP